MKKIIFFITVLSLFLYSCSKDDTVNPNATKENLQIEKRSNDLTKDVTNTGRWLKFKSQSSFDNIYDLLVKEMDNQEGDGYGPNDGPNDGQSSSYDDATVLINWELSLEHFSLRKRNLQIQERLYSKGMHPRDVMPSIQDYGVIDDVLLAFISSEGVFQVGDNVYLYRNGGILIRTTHPDAPDDILDNGTIAVFNPDYVNESDVIKDPHEPIGPGPIGPGPFGPGPGFRGGPECSADFMQFGDPTRNADGTINVTLVWAQAMETADLQDLELSWSWDDGSSDTNDPTGTVSHTYASPGTYNVCLDVSWTFDEEDPTPDVECSTTGCMSITIDEEPPSICNESNVCLFLTGLELTGIEGLIDLTGSSEGMMCLTMDNLLVQLIGVCADIDPSEVTLNHAPSGTEWTLADGTQCIMVPCDAEQPVNVTFGNCTVTFDIDLNLENNSCDDDDYKTGWKWVTIGVNENGISWYLNTESKENALCCSSNHVYAKMIYKIYHNDEWCKEKRKLGMELHGTVFGDQNCECDNMDSPDDTEFPTKDKHTINIKEPIMKDFGGISNNCDMPWFADFYVDLDDDDAVEFIRTVDSCGEEL